MYCGMYRRLIMTTIRSRFQLRRRMLEAHLERNYGEEAGLKGEETARMNLQKKLGPQGWKFFTGVLIPDPNRVKGRFEIDIVAISPKGIVLIEVKHWKGKIEVSEEGMKQIKGKVDYPFNRLDDRINQTSRILRPSIIESGIGDDCPPIKAAIILTHRTSEVSSNKMGEHSILKLSESTAIKSLFDGEDRMDSKIRDHIISKFVEFGTWDTIQHKGKDGNGLIRWGQIPEENNELLVEGIDILDRTKVSHFKIKQVCNWFRTLWKKPILSIKIYLRNNEIIESEIDPETHFPWIQPGIGHIEDGIPIINIEKLDYGRKSNEDPRDKVRLEGIPYSEGDIIRGTVDGWHDTFGLFIELQPNMNGLIPMSLIPNLGLDNLKVLYPRGQSVQVMVTKVDHGRNRIALDFPEGDA